MTARSNPRQTEREIVRDRRRNWLLTVVERYQGGVTLRYVESGRTVDVTEAMFNRDYEAMA